MSTLAIDTPTARSNERLSMFMTEIGAKKPIDNYFSTHPAWDLLMKKKQMKSGGRQIGYPIDSGENPTVADFSDADPFDCSVPDTALWVAYAYVNKGGTVTILGEEQRETEGGDHKIFDVMDHRRNNVIQTVIKAYSQDLFATSLVAGKINTLNLLIDSTGAIGGLNASTDANWASTETTSGSFAAQGLKDMRTLHNTLFNSGGKSDCIVTTQTIYEYYENDIDPDVRYASAQGTANRGFDSLTFKNKPIVYDPYATSGILYMWDSQYTFMACDTGWNFDFEPFVSPADQKVSVSKFANRCQLVTTNRRTSGKLVSITA